MRAIVATTHGEPEVLQLSEQDDPHPGPGQVTVRVHAAGVNLMDIYLRRGMYQVVEPPFVPGVDGAGTVVEVGPDVDSVRVGDRVAWKMELGSYAELKTLPVSRLIAVPPALELEVAAAGLMQGMTAHVIASAAGELDTGGTGGTALVHSAGSGTGRMLTQLLHRRGTEVIATVSRESKVDAARSAGARHVLVRSPGADLAARVRDLTGGRGVRAVFDGTGAEGFASSVPAIAYGGVYVLYGQAGGPVPPLTLWDQPDGVRLMRSRGDRPHASDEDHRDRGRLVLSWLADGTLDPMITRRYPLAEAVQAHRDLESQATTGKLLLLP